MRPPDKKMGRHAGNAAAQKTDSRGSGIERHSTSRPFIVRIIAFGRVREWQRFADRASADAAAGQLRRHGFDARADEVAP
jgi:hypothetical protein